MANHRLDHLVPDLDTPVRLDKYLSDVLTLFPRSQYDRRGVEATADGKTAKPSLKLEGGETLTLFWNDLPEPTFGAEDIPLDVLYEDNEVLVVNKPRGMVVHPAHGNWSGTLAQGLLHRVQNLAENFEDEENSEVRPGIVHRLDKDTTGIIVTAKTPAALEFLAAQFRERTTEKTYVAVLKGVPKAPSGMIEGWLGRDPKNRQRFASVGPSQGKPAVTEWTVLASASKCALVQFRPHTGRTHQLRVHSVVLGFPILGDPIYARPDTRAPEAPLMLHAARLAITLPSGVRHLFSAPLPQDFRAVLDVLGFPDPRPFGID
jgi:23S rRNA pseudouridine1911/1915/1917 synthase